MDRIRFGNQDATGRVTSIEYTGNANQADIITVSIQLRYAMSNYAPPNNGVIVLQADNSYGASVFSGELRGNITNMSYSANSDVTDVYSAPTNQRYNLQVSFMPNVNARLESEENVAVDDDPFGYYDPIPEPIEVAPEPTRQVSTNSFIDKLGEMTGNEENKFEPTSNNRLKHIDEFDTIHREKIEENFDEREDNTI